ncbi:STM4015 family protein [Dactylosporangium sp. NPDC051541]|uniref:STM4015 family protein n=1 Tax=Dactylosporangium sp. NPDC051541 TaxID=3363977 RepID=UPI0037972BA8
MTIGSNLTTFAGLPVQRFELAGRGRRGRGQHQRPRPGERAAYRIGIGYDDDAQELVDTLDALFDAVGAHNVTALLIGSWGEPQSSGPPLQLLIDNRDRLTGLRALFVGEMTYEECEISWINQGEYAPLLGAFPALEVLHIRGADGLSLAPVRHRRLRELCVESGGLPAAFIRGFNDSSFPALADLELWLGTGEYGGDAVVDDLAPIMTGSELPALKRLALRNAEIADDLATALAAAPVVARLESLDLSMGALSDAGAEALLLGQPLTHLRSLDLSHHFMSPEMAARFAGELPAVRVDVSDEQEIDEDGFRYVSVAE